MATTLLLAQRARPLAAGAVGRLSLTARLAPLARRYHEGEKNLYGYRSPRKYRMAPCTCRAAPKASGSCDGLLRRAAR